MTKKSVNEGSAGFSRRQFLEAIGAAGALGMLGTGTSLLSFGAAAAEAKSGDVLTGSHWGAFRAKVQGGRVVSRDGSFSTSARRMRTSSLRASALARPMWPWATRAA